MESYLLMSLQSRFLNQSSLNLNLSIYFKYVPDGTKIVSSCVDDCVYWYTSESLGKWFVDTLGKRFHVNLLGYANWFISIRISQIRDHSISVYQSRYATSIMAKYLDTDKVKTSAKFNNTTLLSDLIFTKNNASTSDKKVEKLTREFNIHYKTCIGSFIYLLSTKVYSSFSVHKTA